VFARSWRPTGVLLVLFLLPRDLLSPLTKATLLAAFLTSGAVAYSSSPHYAWVHRTFYLSGILTILAVVACIFVILIGMSLSEFGQGVLVGILAPALAFFAIRWFYWSAITNAVEVTPAQFPEVYTIRKVQVKKGSKLSLTSAPGGGFAISIIPNKK